MNHITGLRLIMVLGAALFAAAPFAVTGAISQANHPAQVPAVDFSVSQTYTSSAGLVP